MVPERFCASLAIGRISDGYGVTTMFWIAAASSAAAAVWFASLRRFDEDGGRSRAA
jgi:hypothetical protein